MQQSDRNARQSAVLPGMDNVRSVVIGCGAVGRQVAIQLAASGVGGVILIDPDKVEEQNVGSQGYFPGAVGRHKVEELAGSLRSYGTNCDTIHEKFEESFSSYCEDKYVFCCVDSIDDRKEIWDFVGHKAAFWCDARVSTDIARILTVDSPGHVRRYVKSIFSGEEAYEGTCAAANAIYVAYVSAGLMIAQLSKSLRQMPIDPDITINLLSNELTGG